MTFDGKQPFMEDNLWWKTTFDGSRPLMGDNRKMNFNWRQRKTAYREILRLRSAIYRRCRCGHFFKLISFVFILRFGNVSLKAQCWREKKKLRKNGYIQENKANRISKVTTLYITKKVFYEAILWQKKWLCSKILHIAVWVIPCHA